MPISEERATQRIRLRGPISLTKQRDKLPPKKKKKEKQTKKQKSLSTDSDGHFLAGKIVE